MIPLVMLAPIAEKLVGLIAGEIAAERDAGREPDREVAAAWRRLSSIVADADRRVQAVRLPLEDEP